MRRVLQRKFHAHALAAWTQLPKQVQRSVSVKALARGLRKRSVGLARATNGHEAPPAGTWPRKAHDFAGCAACRLGRSPRARVRGQQ